MTSSFMSINKTLPGLPSERSCVNNVLGQNHPGSTPLYLSWSWQILGKDTQNIRIPGLHFPENPLPGAWSRIEEYLLCNSLSDSSEFKNPFPVGQFSSVQSLSHVWLFTTPWTTAHQASLSITNSRSSLKPMSIESVMPSVSSSVVPFSSCRQSFPAAGYFPMSQFFASGDQSIRGSVSASVLPMNIQDWFPLGMISFWILATHTPCLTLQ